MRFQDGFMTARAPRANNFDRPLSKDQTDRADICARRDEMRSAECGMKVIQRDLVGEVGDGEPQREVRVILLAEQILCAHSEIEYVARRKARRTVIVVGS